MYSASANFITAIKKNVRVFHWGGEINFNTPIVLDDDNLFSLKITKSISDNNKLSIGTVFASQLTADIRLPGVSRYALFGKEISVNVSIEGANDVIPMGIYVISEANQTVDHISIKAYDYMTKFDDITFHKSNVLQFPYDWLTQLCLECGVTLGNTRSEITNMPNGLRKTGFADCVADVKTARDALSYLASYLGGYAHVGRDGKVYIKHYKATSDDTIPSNFRYTSGLSDFRTTYDGLYAIYKAGGVQEYVENLNSNGLILDLGTNPFLQFTEASSRQAALQEIINKWNGIYYVPFKSSMPLMPHYDAGDVLTFTGNQAGQYDYGAITQITYNMNGDMDVICSGNNPWLADAQDRFSKTVEGLSNEYSNGQEIGGKNFWMLISENTTTLTAGSTKTQVAEIEWTQSTDVQKIGMMYTCEAVVSATAVVSLELSVDDEANYKFITDEEKLVLGKRRISGNCGFTIEGKGLHTAKVYLTVTDSPLLWGDLA